MSKVLKDLGLPLLLKELIEQSARRRTYIIRVVYVSLFFLACLGVILPEMARSGGSPLNMLGVGRNIFIYIVAWQFAGIYLFLPALTCSVITAEKERNTLGLLFLTRLGPWTIVFEKLLSRLLPMYCLLFCSLPLLAFTISLGCITATDLLAALWFLALTTFQIAAIAVACSAFFRTTTGALLACYALMFVLGFGLPICDSLIFDNAIRAAVQNTVRMFPGTMNNFYIYSEVVLFCFVGFAQFVMQAERGMMFPTHWWLTLLRGLPLILSGLLPLVVARFFLVRRAFVPSRNLLLLFLKRMDGIFHALNNNQLTRGIVILDESRSEPDFSPIAWRETHKRSLGQTRYLVRVLLALEVPVLLIIMTTIFRASDDYYNGGAMVSVMTLLVWLVAALLVTVTSAGLISGERGRQTLDILLTLPITGRQIILDKIAGVRRLVWICAVPLVTCICFEAWWRDVIGDRGYGAQLRYIWWAYLLTALSLVVTYLPLLSWLSIWIGLKTKSPTRATLTALIAIVAWCVIPLIVILVYWESWLRPRGGGSIESAGYAMLLQTSPLGLLFGSEFGSLHQFSEIQLLPMFVNLAIYGSACLILRKRVLLHADRLLGRTRPLDSAVLKKPLAKAVISVTQPSLVE